MLRSSAFALLVLACATPVAAQRSLTLDAGGVVAQYEESLDGSSATATVILVDERDDLDVVAVGPVRFSHVVLKRGVTKSSAFVDWSSASAGDTRAVPLQRAVSEFNLLIMEDMKRVRSQSHLAQLTACATRLASARELAVTVASMGPPSAAEAVLAETLLASAHDALDADGVSARPGNRRDVRSTVGWRAYAGSAGWTPGGNATVSFELFFDRYEEGKSLGSASTFASDPAWKKPPPKAPEKFPELGVLQFGSRFLVRRHVACEDADIVPGGLACALGDAVSSVEGPDFSLTVAPAGTHLRLSSAATLPLVDGRTGVPFAVAAAKLAGGRTYGGNLEWTLYSTTRNLGEGSPWVGDLSAAAGFTADAGYVLAVTTGLASPPGSAAHEYKLQSGFIYATQPASAP